jgi:uncharacterized membrane protein YccF (DUF307 family)
LFHPGFIWAEAAVIWLILCGWWMAILYVLAGLICFVLIITIPFGIANFNIIPISLMPLGVRISPGQSFQRSRPFTARRGALGLFPGVGVMQRSG